MSQTDLPVGWDEARVRRVIAHYEQQTDDDAVAEDEAALTSQPHTIMKVPQELVPAVRELIARHEADRVAAAKHRVGAGHTS